jgi:C4-dicarboxylate-specific signal transduction histidine kinase
LTTVSPHQTIPQLEGFSTWERCLFEAFYTTEPGGLGIGRSISRSIMDSHRDWLWATANPDHGATFHVA